MNEVAAYAIRLWNEIFAWVTLHPIRTDILVVAFAAGILTLALLRQRRIRRKFHRLVWGASMKRKDREKYQMMRFEDAITDAAMEMIQEGNMTEDQDKEWMKFFAERYQFKGLIPRRDVSTVKRGCKKRAFMLQHTPDVSIPGGKPGVEKVDVSYQPSAPEPEGLTTSRYAKIAGS